jgi:dienelactone hydrolase
MMMVNNKLRNTIVGLVLIQFVLVGCVAPVATPTILVPTSTPPVQITRDILYATPLDVDVSEQKLDVYAPYEVGSWPVVVFLHGFDGLKEGHVRESQAIAEQGVVVFTANWPTPLMDVAGLENGKGFREMAEVLSCAVRFARANAADYGGDPSQVILIGFSYGAGLGAWMALAEENLDDMWDDFAAQRGGPEPQVACTIDGGSASVDAFIGIGGGYRIPKSLQDRDVDLWEFVSPISYIEQRLELPVRLLHGEQDTLVNSRHSTDFNDVLMEAGYDTQLILYDGEHHVPAVLTAEAVLELAGE